MLTNGARLTFKKYIIANVVCIDKILIHMNNFTLQHLTNLRYYFVMILENLIIHDAIVSLLELFIITNNGATFVHAIFNKNKSERINIIEPFKSPKMFYNH